MMLKDINLHFRSNKTFPLAQGHTGSGSNWSQGAVLSWGGYTVQMLTGDSNTRGGC